MLLNTPASIDAMRKGLTAIKLLHVGSQLHVAMVGRPRFDPISAALLQGRHMRDQIVANREECMHRRHISGGMLHLSCSVGQVI